MNEARETALRTAVNIHAGHGMNADSIIREAHKIEAYLKGDDGPQPTENDPDFAEVGETKGDEICWDTAEALEGSKSPMPRTRRQLVGVTRDCINRLLDSLLTDPSVTDEDARKVLHSLMETNPDFGEEIKVSVISDEMMARIDAARRITPNDVTRGRCIMQTMFSQHGWTAPPMTFCDDIVRTILRGFLDARSE